MVACNNRLEKSIISNNRFVILMAHFISIVKVLTSITATIRNNPTPPNGLQIGVVISLVLSFEALKVIEPDYLKAHLYFWSYWSLYLIALWINYSTILYEQIFAFCSLFWMIGIIYKESYFLSNSLTEIFYEFHNEPTVIFDRNSKFKVNRSFLHNFGNLVTTKQIQHHSEMLTEITNPEDLNFVRKLQAKSEKVSLLQILKNRDEMEDSEIFLIDGDKEKVFVFTYFSLENIYDSKTVWVFKNITHVHQLQKIKMQIEVRFRSVIMGCLTHELRTPINCVISMLKSLRDFIEDSDEARKWLTVCQGTIEMLRSLTEDFIDFTRFEDNKWLPVEKGWFKISKFFEDISNIFSFQAEEKGLEFNIHQTSKVPANFYTDSKRLKQIILNLLSNAFKFTQRGKIEINISTKEEWVSYNSTKKTTKTQKMDISFNKSGKLYSTKAIDFKKTQNFKIFKRYRNYLIIEVTDTGSGISEQVQDELFNRFGTGKTSKNFNTNGLGLGLHLSKRICTSLNGDIFWESVEGFGSSFIIKLPFDDKDNIKDIFQNQRFSEKSAAKKKFNAGSNSNLKIFNWDLFEENEFSEFLHEDSKPALFKELDTTYSFAVKTNKFHLAQKISSKSELLSSSSSDQLGDYDKSEDEFTFKNQQLSLMGDFKLNTFWNCNQVLIVDDLAFNLLAVELMLNKKFGLDADKAFSGEEAIAKVKLRLMGNWCKRYSLILMDYYMPPGMNGAEASVKIKKTLKQHDWDSVIACFTSQREGDFSFNKNLEIFDRIYSKPLQPNEVKEWLLLAQGILWPV
jgi:signal transduction histidine kinase/CheY-like chemotaxis protein